MAPAPVEAAASCNGTVFVPTMYTTWMIVFLIVAAFSKNAVIKVVAACNALLVCIIVYIYKYIEYEHIDNTYKCAGLWQRDIASTIDFCTHALPALLSWQWIVAIKSLPLLIGAAIIPCILVAIYTMFTNLKITYTFQLELQANATLFVLCAYAISIAASRAKVN